MDRKESHVTGRHWGCPHSCDLNLVAVGVSKDEDIFHHENYDRLDQGFDGGVGVPVRRAKEFFVNEVWVISCWNVGVH